MSDDPIVAKTLVRSSEGTGPGIVGTAGVGGAQPTTVIAVPIWQIVGVRVLRLYVQTVLGVLTADGFGVIELAGPNDLGAHILKAAFIGLAPAFIALLQETVEFLAKFDVTHPQLRG